MEHNAASGSLLHGLKGAASASDDTVATANGSGATVWTKISDANFPDDSQPFNKRLLHIQYQENSGTNNQTPVTSRVLGLYFPYLLNTVVVNEISGASLASNIITLPAGTYDFASEAYCANKRISFLAKIVSGTYTLFLSSLNGDAAFGSSNVDLSVIRSRFIISTATDFRLLVYNTLNVSSPLGLATSSGEKEVYADLRFWKIA